MAERGEVDLRLHIGVIVSHDGIGYASIALTERLDIDIGGEARIGDAVGIEDMQSPAAHTHIIHQHEREFP